MACQQNQFPTAEPEEMSLKMERPARLKLMFRNASQTVSSGLFMEIPRLFLEYWSAPG